MDKVDDFSLVHLLDNLHWTMVELLHDRERLIVNLPVENREFQLALIDLDRVNGNDVHPEIVELKDAILDK